MQKHDDTLFRKNELRAFRAHVWRGISIASFLVFAVYVLEQADNAIYIRSDEARFAICGATSLRDLKTVDRLRQRGVSLDVPCGYEKKTPLSIAAQQGDLRVVEYLLVRGANPHINNRYGQSPLQVAERELAVEQGWSSTLSYTRIVRLLKDAGNRDSATQ